MCTVTRPRVSLQRLAAIAAALAACACTDGTAPGGADPPSQYIAVRRAWQPGERAATIARIQQSGGFGLASFYAEDIYADTDSVTVIAPNPDYLPAALPPGMAGLTLGPDFATSWNIGGMDIFELDTTVTPPDTTHWLEVLWSNPAEPTWFGFVVGAATGPTMPRTDVNTTAFDASFGKTGAGGGEIRSADGTYWQANGPVGGALNDYQVTAATYGAASTVTTGPYLGGTSASGFMYGRIQRVTMTRLSGATLPTSMTVDFDFRSTPISAVQIVCVFRSPCTTNVPALRSARDAAARVPPGGQAHAP